jgi:hypothetical protein
LEQGGPLLTLIAQEVGDERCRAGNLPFAIELAAFAWDCRPLGGDFGRRKRVD